MTLTKSGYLKAMGIDVWTTRGAAMPQAQLIPDEIAPPVVVAVPRSTSAPVKHESPSAPAIGKTDKGVSAEVPKFRLALFHYESIGLCLSLGPGKDPPRRFCDDVARTMGGKVDSVRYQLLQWPMLSTSGIDQSINAAREVVTQKFGQMPERVLVFGEDLAEYYLPLRDLAPVSHGEVSVGKAGSQSFLLVPSLDHLLGSGAAKRELMLAMHHWLAG